MQTLLSIATPLAGGAADLAPRTLAWGRSMWLTEPSSTFASRHDPLFLFVLWVSIFFFLLIVVGMVWFVWKYRRRPGVAPLRSAAHNTPLEVFWTVAPSLLLAWMFVWGFEEFLYMSVPPADAEEIQIKAYQWGWEATYDNGAGTDEFVDMVATQVPVFAAPANKPIKLIMSSRDVLHSFYVPDFRVKMDVLPNRYSTSWFEATSEPVAQYNEQGEKVGEWIDHKLFCTEYCGDQHSQMAGLIRVMSQADYEAWKAAKANIFEGRTMAEVGEILYTTKGCVSCHSIDGSRGTGPTWLGIYGGTEELRSGETVQVDENYLRRSILEPAAQITAGYPNQMTMQDVTDRELDALIAFIKSLSEEGRQELEQEQEEGGGEGEESA